MTQKRTFDYHSPRATSALNNHLVDILTAGIYRGFDVGADGVIQPGVLLSADGVRIEETEENTVSIPARDNAAYKRRDLVVCEYAYEEAETPPVAIYRVVKGTEAASNPSYPEIPDNCLVLAWCEFDPPATTEWSKVVCNFPNEKLINCTASTTYGQYSYTGFTGGSAARITFDSEAGTLNVQIVDNLDFEDGFEFGDPCAVLSSDGLAQVNDLAGAGRTDETVKGVADLLTAILGEGWTDETIMDAVNAAGQLASAFSLEHYPSGSLDEDGNSVVGHHKNIIQQARRGAVGDSKTLLRQVWMPQTNGDARRYEEWVSNAGMDFWRVHNATWNNSTSRWGRLDVTKPAYAALNDKIRYFVPAGSDAWTDGQWIEQKYAMMYAANPAITCEYERPALAPFTTEIFSRNPRPGSNPEIITRTMPITAVDTDGHKFTVSNVAYQYDLLTGLYFNVAGSTDALNDGGYTIKGVVVAGNNITIEVNEEIPSDTISGSITTWVYISAAAARIVKISPSVFAHATCSATFCLMLKCYVNGELYKLLDKIKAAALETDLMLKGEILLLLEPSTTMQILIDPEVANYDIPVSISAAGSAYSTITIEEV